MEKYNLKLDVNTENSLSRIEKMVSPKSKILEMGSSYGRLTKYLKETKDCTVDIVEIDENAGKEAAVYARKALLGKKIGNLNQNIWYETLKQEKETYDFIIFADVLEHLQEPESVLRCCSELLSSQGSILLSVPNIAHNAILINLFNDEFEYQELGLLDNTHIHLFSYKSLKRMIQKCDYIIIREFGISKTVTDTEFSVTYELVNDEVAKELRKRKYGDVYQFVFELKRKRDYIENPVQQLSYYNTLIDYLFSCYIKTQNEFDEKNKIVRYFFPQGKFDEKINLNIWEKDKPKEIRLDPLNKNCIVKNVEFILFTDAGEKIEVKNFSHNGKQLNKNIYFFSNDDPHFYIYLEDYNGISFSELRVCWEFIDYDSPKISLWEKIYTEVKEYAEIKENENNILKSEHELYEKEKINLHRQMEILEKETTKICKQFEARESEKWEAILQEEKRKNEDIVNEKNELVKKLNIEINDKKDLERENAELIVKYNSAKYSAAQYQVMYDTISNATFWKLTFPMRKIMDLLKKITGFHYKKVLINKGMQSLKNNGVRETWRKVKHYLHRDIDTSWIAKNNDIFPALNDCSFKSFVKDFSVEYKQGENKLFLENEIGKYDDVPKEKIVLLVSHEASLTGAPIALYRLAECLKEKGYYPIFLTPKNGTLVDDLVVGQIPVIIYEAICSTNFILRYRNLFGMVVVNTIIPCPLITALNNTDTNVLWWIHESKLSYSETYQKILPNELSDNIHVYAVGEYAKNVLLKYRPSYNVATLLYMVLDYAHDENNERYNIDNLSGKKVFACIGTLEDRKGQDQIVKAIELLEHDELQKSVFLFIGRKCSPNVNNSVEYALRKYPKNIIYIEELPQKKMPSLYRQIDCLICSSLDDPMPIVVTEAFCLSKLVICSEFTGSASIIKKMDAGIIYHNNDINELAKIIKKVIANDIMFNNLCQNARIAYEKYFSPKAFNEKIDKILDKVCTKPILESNVSIIIPTYNAGADFIKILDMLQQQLGVEKIEIIIVDSGSNDGTIDLCREKGISPILISKEDFSHSYARNLGAKSANGDILLFMTQDALPSNNRWIEHMITPILQDNVAAVTCKEKCPDNTDLFYCISSNIHNNFMGIDKKDKEGNMENCVDDITLRQNAGLNDIACAIRKSVFDEFLYRYNYAEDLDLGIRLLKKGYKLKFLSSEFVYHGHNRPTTYYLKRSIVETSALDKIFERNSVNRKNASDLLGLVVAYGSIEMSIYELQNISQTISNFNDFFEALDRFLESSFDRSVSFYVTYCNNIEIHNEIDYIISKLAQVYVMLEDTTHAYEILYHIKYYVDTHLKVYVVEHKYDYNEKNQKQIFDAMRKQLAILIGSEVVYLDKNNELYSYVKGLENGV